MDKHQTVNHQSKCRTCFGQTKSLQPLQKLTVVECAVQMSYAEMLEEVASIKVQEDKYHQEMPQHICICCLRKLKSSHAFIKQVQEVNEKLWSCITAAELDRKQKLDCLEESEIDIQKCLEIKMESEDEDDDLNTVQDVMAALPEQYDLRFKTEDNTLHEDIINESTDNLAETEKDRKQVNHDKISLSMPHSTVEDCLESDTYNKVYLSKVTTFKQITKEVSTRQKRKQQEQPDGKSTDEDADIPVPCHQCNKIFNNSKELSSHLRNAHVPEDQKCACPVCGAKFTRTYNMYTHMRSFHETEYLKMLSPTKERTQECEKCHRKYTSKKNLKYHIKLKHNNDDSSTTETTEVPKKKREVRPLCSICGSSVANKAQLVVHMRRHTGEKPFKCELCDRAFLQITDLNSHRRIHTGEKPYKCKICEKAFRVSTKLANHMRSHTDERPYQCTQCERSFKYSKDLNIHTRIHTGERPYCCNVCGSTFTQSNSLKTHRTKLGHMENNNV